MDCHQGDAELRYLADAGIRPEVELTVVHIAPFGMVTVETPAGEQSLPEEITQLIDVAPAAAADSVEVYDGPVSLIVYSQKSERDYRGNSGTIVAMAVRRI